MKMNKIESTVKNYIVRHNMWKHDGFISLPFREEQAA